MKDRRARSTTACQTLARGLIQPFSVAVSPDGRFVYVGSDYGRSGAIASFRRGASGELTPLAGASGCFAPVRGCRRAKGIKGVRAAGFFGQDWQVRTGEFAWMSRSATD